MTPRDNGKVWEREVAKAFGTTRTGPRGLAVADVEYPHVAIECKYQNRLSLKKRDLEQAKHNAYGKPWSLCLREAKTGVRLAVVDFDEYVKLVRYYYEGRENG